MLTHDQLIFVIRSLRPSITEMDHGRQFWVAMPVEGETQLGPAFIAQWKFKDIDPPTDDEVRKEWARIKDSYEPPQMR